ncbi:uncharacterized protein NECHADRAFT_87616 [Fusarium vanettenii 77-13-4]|uniref:Uncharacterized protein n=1 Tax=Fusarium vanettenii (strain ATCC MYA-4622 / CBS 123669 / FGSC 9596 / NRRL 45880 / 77-13-4) TaxID=660122 RepID=C7Z2I8_FUSV7|nr:uncharacterized protein NECHADRAFT_87616 [Fusarium vanettenii 77-13-4]EEU41485.1 hypothetical protein NECHADRAFT_87616 [Fusarium vanettenii 77-13-4]
MADPFSIIGLLGVAAQFIQLAVDFGSDWKDVPDDTRALITELQGLKAVLSVTHINILIHDDFRDAFLGRRAVSLSHPGIADPNTTTVEMVSSCKKGLEDLLKALRQCERGHRVGWQRIKGAFNAKATRDKVEDLHRRCEILNKMVSIGFQAATYNEVKAIREEQRDWRQSEENKGVLAWLSGLSFEDTHRAVLTKRHPNTGQWFLDKDEFTQWRDGQSNKKLRHFGVLECIFCSELTEPSSVVIDHLRQQFDDATIGIAFVYCDYKDRLNQTPSNLLSSLAKQLARQKQVLPKEVKDLYDKHANNETLPSLDEYSTLFSQLVTSFSQTFVIVDGLDEHVGEEDDGSLNTDFIDRLRQVEQQDGMNGRMRLFVTSRGNDTIREHLDGCVSINIHALASDIRTLVRSRISDNNFRYSRALRENQRDLADKIVEALAEKAQGMLASPFLLAHLHVDQLGRQTNIRDLRRTLNNLPRPSKINSLYEGAMERINRQPEGDKNLALKTLSWVVRARRPLLLSELLIALALNPEDDDLDEDSIPVDSLIASLTAGLLIMEPTSTDQDKIVRLAHFTVAEYFNDEGSQYLIYTEDHLAETCLNYLLFENMEPDLPTRQSDPRYGFYDYAANHWGHHVQAASTSDQNSVMRFLSNETKAKTCCTALNEYLNWPESKALYLTAHFKLGESMRALITAGCDINAATPKGWTLLLSFVERGQEAVVRLLLDNGADINPRATQGNISLREPLAIAAEQGNQAMVRLLLDYGADPNAEVQGGQEIRRERTVPLVNAAKNGHIEVIEMLLGMEGIRINEMVEGRKTAYYWAMVRGHREVARLLQSRGGTL